MLMRIGRVKKDNMPQKMPSPSCECVIEVSIREFPDKRRKTLRIGCDSLLLIRFFPLHLLCFLTVSILAEEYMTFQRSPVGIRQYSMGSVGVTIADDETAIYYNPAGLGLKNSTLQNGSATYQWDEYQPIDKSNFAAIAMQLPQLHNLGIASYCHFVPDITIEQKTISPNGLISSDTTYHLYDYSAAFGAGISFFSSENVTHCFGIGINISTHNNFADEIEPTVNFNSGYLACIYKRFRFGFQLLFDGKAAFGKVILGLHDTIHNPNYLFFSTGIGYKDGIQINSIDFLKVAAEFSYFMLQPCLRIGGEIQFFNTLSLRGGNADEFLLGWGISLLNHFEFNMDWVALKQNPQEVDRFGFSLRLTRIFSWSNADLKWWKHKE